MILFVENDGLFAVDFHANGFKCIDSGGQNIDGYKVLHGICTKIIC